MVVEIYILFKSPVWAVDGQINLEIYHDQIELISQHSIFLSHNFSAFGSFTCPLP